MRMHYNIIAGGSLERLAALSDGVFAIAMTLLVLELHVPEEVFHGELELWSGLVKLAPNFLAYFMSFLTLGIFWVGQQTQLNNFARSNRDLTWIQLGFLLAVTLMPFSTALLATHITFRIALIVYWFNIFLLGTMLYISLWYAERARLLKEGATQELTAEGNASSSSSPLKLLQRRIIFAQALYAFGALLCIFSTYVSIGFIFLVQLYYVFAPRIRWLDRLFH